MNVLTKIKIQWLLICVLFSPICFALPDDDQKALSVTSDQFEFNNKTGVWTYTGHVIADQGSRHLTSDQLFVYRGNNGDISKVVALGEPSHISFQNKAEDPRTNGFGRTITYNANEKTLVLENNAKIENGGDTYNAPLIHYKMDQEVVTSPKSEKGRTTIVIQPRNGQKVL